jgi:hypothetical protein
MEVIEEICRGLKHGFLYRIGKHRIWSWESGAKNQIEAMIATVVKEEVLEDRDVLSKLGLGEEPVPIQRIHLFLPDPAAVEQQVRKLGEVFPQTAEVTLDIADPDLSNLFEVSGLESPWWLGQWVARLPVRWAVVKRSSILLEFGGHPGLDEGMLIQRAFGPKSWEAQGQRIYLFFE